MRAAEFLFESYDEKLNSAVKMVLLKLKSLKIPQIKTQIFVNQLQKMGYSVDLNSLVDTLNNEQNSVLVTSATPDIIQIKSDAENIEQVDGNEMQSQVAR